MSRAQSLGHPLPRPRSGFFRAGFVQQLAKGVACLISAGVIASRRNQSPERAASPLLLPTKPEARETCGGRPESAPPVEEGHSADAAED